MENLNQNKSAVIIADSTEENQEKNQNICKLASLKLNDEANTVSGQNVPAIAIFHYLLDKVADDKDFAACVMTEEKILSKCFTYVTEAAFNLGLGQNPNRKPNEAFTVGMSSTEIFGLVNEYYQLSDAEIENRKNQKLEEIKAQREAAEKIKADEAKKLAQKKQEAKAAKEAKAKEKAAKEAKAKEKAAKEAKAKEKAEKKENKEAQFSLFDMQGGDSE